MPTILGQGDGLITSKKEPQENMQLVSFSKRHKLLNYYVFSNKGKSISRGEQIQERVHFDFIKHALMPLDNVMCYTCTAPAVHRHHVIPICRGGASTLRNLVGLCFTCHQNYEYIAHKGQRLKREASRVSRISNQQRQKVFRTGSLSRFSRVVFKP